MKFTFWGVRGSIPVPGPQTLRYGGNTTCIEVRGAHDELIILDAGTGIFQLARQLLADMPLEASIFITHTHWDHIQGLPFFIPIFVAGNRIRIHGAADPVNQRDIREVLSRQMDYAFFPVRNNELAATMDYVTLREGETTQAGSVTVTSMIMGHPVLDFAYRLESGGRTLVFTGDHEWPYNIHAPGEEGHAEYEALVQERRAAIIDFFRGADALIIDSAYTPEEYPRRTGWGHGTFDASIRAAREAGVGQVWLTHHEPTRDDDELDRVFAEALERNPPPDPAQEPAIHLAREGVTVTL
ncbi:MBL fold metallo-hydrolase [Thioalkalivibrio sp. ALJ24]|uniref:MBL fold metallo-hydrolase n=1 Tax=Thioalkalivibrio sp. ALJ24 TaxID=545276 RepID=UPI0003751A39|nr:MBL fold metallo-hydrolase [Thioalkalivibrio sp. ALJ24]